MGCERDVEGTVWKGMWGREHGEMTEGKGMWKQGCGGNCLERDVGKGA